MYLERGNGRGAKRAAIVLGPAAIDRIVGGRYEWRDAGYTRPRSARRRAGRRRRRREAPRVGEEVAQRGRLVQDDDGVGVPDSGRVCGEVVAVEVARRRRRDAVARVIGCAGRAREP